MRMKEEGKGSKAPLTDSFLRYPNNKTMGTKRKGQPDKKHAPRTLVATAANKELFIEQLAAGIAPGDAAEAINIDRSTAYAWKKDDGLFSARWDNAVETSLDKLETVLYNAAKSGDINAIMNTLKYRRKHVYSNNISDADRLSGSQTNYFHNVTLQEQLERLDRLGLPRPIIESDREEDYELPKEG